MVAISAEGAASETAWIRQRCCPTCPGASGLCKARWISLDLLGGHIYEQIHLHEKHLHKGLLKKCRGARPPAEARVREGSRVEGETLSNFGSPPSSLIPWDPIPWDPPSSLWNNSDST